MGAPTVFAGRRSREQEPVAATRPTGQNENDLIPVSDFGESGTILPFHTRRHSFRELGEPREEESSSWRIVAMKWKPTASQEASEAAAPCGDLGQAAGDCCRSPRGDDGDGFLSFLGFGRLAAPTFSIATYEPLITVHESRSNALSGVHFFFARMGPSAPRAEGIPCALPLSLEFAPGAPGLDFETEGTHDRKPQTSVILSAVSRQRGTKSKDLCI